MKYPSLLSLAALALSACSSAPTQMAVVEGDPETRAALWETLSGLEGRWTSVTPYGEGEHIFEVTSMDSVVREFMAPGTENEMTNMYTLDGNGVAMTHYCGAGNQPHMRASGLEGGRLEFRSVSVGDMMDPGEQYMGNMTLVIIDEDHIEQHWTSIVGEEMSEMGAFQLTRVR